MTSPTEKIECNASCGGCACHINPPCSHCEQGHGFEVEQIPEEGPNYIRNKIRRGELPRYSFARNADGTMETKPDKHRKVWKLGEDGKPVFEYRKKRTWRLISTEVMIKEAGNVKA